MRVTKADRYLVRPTVEQFKCKGFGFKSWLQGGEANQIGYMAERQFEQRGQNSSNSAMFCSSLAPNRRRHVWTAQPLIIS